MARNVGQCVFWHGNHVTDGGVAEAVVEIRHEDGSENRTYVNRLLLYLFTTEQSYQSLLALPGTRPLTMACGCQLCLNLQHIDTSGAQPQEEEERAKGNGVRVYTGRAARAGRGVTAAQGRKPRNLDPRESAGVRTQIQRQRRTQITTREKGKYGND